jgi:hypothetical protein
LPVTLIVFPFFTQVMVFLLLEMILRVGELIGVGDDEGCLEARGDGDVEGSAITISAALIEGDADGEGVGEAEGEVDGVVTGAGVGNLSLS